VILRLFLLFAALVLPAAASAHESRPAMLSIIEQADGAVEISFRQPIGAEGATIALEPKLSSGWIDRQPDRIVRTQTAMERAWLVPSPDASLAGQEVSIIGLDSTILDVLLSIERPGLARQTMLLNADMPETVIGEAGNGLSGGIGWMRLGVDHILGGYDHLAFVLGLMLLVRHWRGLVLALTSFTLAHSLTLAMTTLGYISLPSRPVEAAIALSIVILAIEAVQERKGQVGWLRGRPWLMAFPFGLLHGLGFAGALGEMGLDPDHVAWPLLWFNIGVEIGQLIFVATVLAVSWLVMRFWREHFERLRRATPYVIGPLAMFWLFQRLAQM
jgi:hydrogenase/urease accessory protein HupE